MYLYKNEHGQDKGVLSWELIGTRDRIFLIGFYPNPLIYLTTVRSATIR